MKLECINRTKEKMPKAMLGRWLEACLPELSSKDRRKIGKKELLIVFVSAREIKELNSQFRGKKYPTDVLSFESLEPSSLGEMVLSPQVLRSQALRTGLTYNQELCYMVLHGLLHLIGYDHETSARDEKVMFGLQDRIFQSLASEFKFR